MEIYSGDDIRLIRQAHTGADGRQLRQLDVARSMGCSRQWVAQLEGRRRLPLESVRRFVAAVLAASR